METVNGFKIHYGQDIKFSEKEYLYYLLKDLEEDQILKLEKALSLLATTDTGIESIDEASE